MNNEKCCVIKDLLPLYIDELCSDETAAIVRKHLDECESCNKAYTAMKSEVPGNDNDGILPVKIDPGTSDEHDKQLIKKVSRDVKNKTNRSNVVSVIAVVFALFIIFGFTVPVIPIRSDSIEVNVINPTLFVNAKELSYYDLSEKDIVLYEGDKDLTKCTFKYAYIRNMPDITLAIDVEMLGNDNKEDLILDNVRLVTLSSDKPIKSYKTDTDISGTEKKLVIKNVRTTLFSGSNNSVSSVTFLNTDGFDVIDI